MIKKSEKRNNGESEIFTFEDKGVKNISIYNLPKKINSLAINQANYIFDCFNLNKRNIPQFYMSNLNLICGTTNPDENIIIINDRIVNLDCYFEAYLDTVQLNNKKERNTMDFLKEILTHEISHNIFSQKYLDFVYTIFKRSDSSETYKYVDSIDEALAFFCEDYFCGGINSLFEENSKEYDYVDVKIMKHFYLAFHSLANQGRLDIIFEKLPGFVYNEFKNVREHTLERILMEK